MDNIKKQIAVGVITELTKDAIKSICGSIKKYFEEDDKKMDIDFGNAYERYLKIASEKIRMVKTLIYRKEPRDIYSIYESVNIVYQDSEISSEKVSNIIDLGHRIIITGTAGIGDYVKIRLS